jgi:hypothetical protein
MGPYAFEPVESPQDPRRCLYAAGKGTTAGR